MDEITGKFHHVGYLVKDLEKSRQAFLDLGFSEYTGSKFDEIRNAYICFLNGNGILVELIEPTEASDIYPLLKKYTNMPYHLCYVVKDISFSVKKLKEKGFLLFKDTEDAPAVSEDARVAFLLHHRIGMIELLQEGTDD